MQVIKVHESHEVYIPKAVYDDIVNEARSLPLLVKHLVKNVFTREALQGSTAQGYPNRVRGSDRLRQRDVLPRLDPSGREAILRKFFFFFFPFPCRNCIPLPCQTLYVKYFISVCAKKVQEDKKSWRPRARPNELSQYFSQAVGDQKADINNEDDSEEDGEN